MQPLSRRRFLTDLAFICGALLLAAGLGATPPPPPAQEHPLPNENHPAFFPSTGMQIERP